MARLAAELRLTLGQFRIRNQEHKGQPVLQLHANVPAAVRESFDRAQAARVFDHFYQRFINADPRIGRYFARTDFSRQQTLLRDGVVVALPLPPATRPAGSTSRLWGAATAPGA